MVTVRLEGLSGAVRTVDLPEGGAVVVEGAALLREAEDDELQVLDAFGVTPSRQRLACQAKVTSGTGLVRLRAVRDDE